MKSKSNLLYPSNCLCFQKPLLVCNLELRGSVLGLEPEKGLRQFHEWEAFEQLDQAVLRDVLATRDVEHLQTFAVEREIAHAPLGNLRTAGKVDLEGKGYERWKSVQEHRRERISRQARRSKERRA